MTFPVLLIFSCRIVSVNHNPLTNVCSVMTKGIHVMARETRLHWTTFYCVMQLLGINVHSTLNGNQ